MDSRPFSGRRKAPPSKGVAEPAILAEDVQRVLKQAIRPGDPDEGEAVSRIAARAGVSTRTVYRILKPDEDGGTMTLDLADRLVIAAGRQLSEIDCHAVVDGRLVEYADA